MGPSTNVFFIVARLDASTTHHTTGDDPSYCLILECKFAAGGKTGAHQAAGRIDALPLRPALEIILLPKGWGIQQTRRRRTSLAIVEAICTRSRGKFNHDRYPSWHITTWGHLRPQ